MSNRPEYLSRLTTAIKRAPIIALLGSRQYGKTTLARMIARDLEATYFDLESREALARWQNPELALSSVQNLVIIDEIQ